MNDRLKFGIEEEYFITDLATRQMPGNLPFAVTEKCRTELGQSFAYEMFQGQVEVASPILTSIPQAADYLVNARGILQHSLEALN